MTCVGAITRDVERITQWVAKSQGIDCYWPVTYSGAVGYQFADRLVAGIIWLLRADRSAVAHIAIDVPSATFARAAFDAIFADADEVHFSIPAGNAAGLRLAAAMGAKRLPVDRRTDPAVIHFLVRQENLHGNQLFACGKCPSGTD